MALNSATNFVRQSVGSSVGTANPETIDVTDASAFADPSVAEYDIVIWDVGTFNRPDQDPDVEVLRVTGRDTTNNTLTCSRAQQGTTNVSHPNTSDVIVTPLAEGDFKDVNAQTVTTEESRSTDPYTSGQQRIELIEDGVWTWFTGPTAVYDEQSDKIFTGGVSRAGNIIVASYNRSTGEVVTNDLGFLEKDDHDNPGILVRPSDGRVLIAYSKHTGPQIHWRISSNPRDISAFDAEQTMDPGNGSYTYIDPWYDETTGTIRLIYRDNDQIAMVESTDGGASWGSQTVLVNGLASGYKQTHSKGGARIDFGLTNSKDDVRHVYYDASSNTLHKTDGTTIGSPPVDFSNTTQIYDTTANDSYAWVWDCIRRDDGTIEIVFVEFSGTTPSENGQKPHTYAYARWDGSSWDYHRLTEAWPLVKTGEEPHYSPGLCLDWNEKGVAYLSVGGASNTEIKKWKTPDGGDTWNVRDYGAYPQENIRPRWVKNAPEDVPVLWLNGRYEMWNQERYDTRIVGGGAAGGQSGPEPVYGYTKFSYNGAGQDISSGSWARISWDAADVDLHRWGDLGTNQIVPPGEEHLYLIRATVGFEAMTAGGLIEVDIQRGSGELNRIGQKDVSAGDTPLIIGDTIKRVTDDSGSFNRFNVVVRHDTGSTETIEGDPIKTNFEVVRIA